MLDGLFLALAALFAVVNPVSISIYFLSLSGGMGEEARMRMAIRATAIAALIAAGAALLGGPFLEFMGVRLGSFRIAGGIVLLLFGLKSGLGISAGRGSAGADPTSTPLASPLITGPGVISVSILLSTQVGIYTCLAAIAIAMAVILLGMLSANAVRRRVGDSGALVVSRVMGLVLSAVAVQFIVRGLAGG